MTRTPSLTSRIQPLRRTADNTIELLDQRLLPGQEVWLPIQTAAEAAEAIHAMVVRGAPAIGITAAYGLSLLGTKAVDASLWHAAAQTMSAARPTAINLRWAVDRMTQRWEKLQAESTTADAFKQTLWAEALTIHREDVAMNQQIGRHGADLLAGDTLSLLTHCNTGGLATGGWGTALGVARSLADAGRLACVYATETRPYWQGARLTAWELQQERLPHALLPDSAAAALLAAGRVDAVVVGADRIAANGDVANKIGTYMLALAAQQHAVPFYVAAPCSTVDRATATGGDIPIEFRQDEELTYVDGKPLAPLQTPAWNPAFDITPAGLISGLILDRGPVTPVTRERLAEVLGGAG